MRELLDLLNRADVLTREGHPAVLATLVKIQGSAYRHAGARMLIERDGTWTGFLSAGCLESDLALRSKEVLETGKPRIVTYDTSAPEDIVWGLGLGCNGLLDILLERTDSPSVQRALHYIRSCTNDRRAGVMATLVHTQPDRHGHSGTCAVLLPDGTIQSELTDWPARELAAEMDAVAQSGISSTIALEMPDGPAEVFVEALPPPVRVAVYGSGPDVPPLVTITRNLGWHVTVLDRRSEQLLRQGLPEADEVISVPPEQVPGRLTPAKDTALLIMTHNFAIDKELLRAWLPTAAPYLGILGPRRRTEELLDALRKEGFHPTSQQLGRLHSPVGLDIGSDSPGSIALAIVAEIEAALHHREGGFLKDRKGPIHELHTTPRARRKGKP